MEGERSWKGRDRKKVPTNFVVDCLKNHSDGQCNKNRQNRRIIKLQAVKFKKMVAEIKTKLMMRMVMVRMMMMMMMIIIIMIK